MTPNKELIALIERARAKGAIVTVTHDQVARLVEGREIIDTVQISGLKGCGPHAMSAIAAAERLREVLESPDPVVSNSERRRPESACEPTAVMTAATGLALRAEAVRAKADLDQVLHLRSAGPSLFDVSGAYAAAKQQFREWLEGLPKDGYSLQAKTSDGRLMVLNASAQRPGKWQTTRFDHLGQPWGDTQYDKLSQALKDFLDDVDVSTVADYAGLLSPEIAITAPVGENVPPKEAAERCSDDAMAASQNPRKLRC